MKPYQPAVEYRDKIFSDQPASQSFLEDDEKVSYEIEATFVNNDGKSKEVNLVMTDKPRIVIFNLKKTKVKAEIPILPEVKVEKTDKSKLKFSEPETSFEVIFKAEKDADFWYQTITLLLSNED